MFILRLNDMRSSQIEVMTEVCRAGSRQELVDFLARETVKAYNDIDGDRAWLKEFRKGGPLEWYNPSVWRNPIVEVGSRQQVIDHAIASANEHYDKLERIPTLEAIRNDT